MSNMREQKQEPTNADLITTLQTGPGSRELSDQVLVALGWTTKLNWNGMVFSSPDMLQVGTPDPTQSIDDALALVPEGRSWEVLYSGSEMRCDFELASPPGAAMTKKGLIALEGAKGSGPTLALAICIAILKAKEAE